MSKPITEKEAENYSDALSDVLCWMDGFKAGGGVYFPDSVETLRNLNLRMKDICDKEIKTTMSHS
jgi:hypothetical protein